MTALPSFLRWLPFAFYIAAVIVGAWRVFNEISMVSATYAYAEALGGFEGVQSIARSTAYYWGVVDALYLVASGAMIHVLVAIFDNVKGSGE